jgi:lysophospholipase L1-like esterase
MKETRRDFIRKTALAGLAVSAIPSFNATPRSFAPSSAKIKLNKGSVILFQGDSITDAGRNREDQAFNTPKILGTGYAFLAAAELLNEHAAADLKIYNRGISGNKVYQLAERWDKDCLELKPDVLSILIGVNDFWHKLNGNYDGTVEKYRNDYMALVERTLVSLPSVKLIICEPFAVSGTKAVNEKWFPEFDGYRAASKEVAEKFGALFIPYQSVFSEAQKVAPATYWTGDGVHPSLAGAALMAEAWLESVK